MRSHWFEIVHRRGGRRPGRAHSLFLLGAALQISSLSGCGSVEARPPEQVLAARKQAVEELNGLGTNGLGTNGLGTNGLGTNGLGTNGLASAEFSTWFQTDPELNAQVMKYFVFCAVPAGATRTYADSASGTTYSWRGGLGLAPDWSEGMPANVAEQQLVSACLAAHVNMYGAHVPISLLGRDARGEVIPFTNEELKDFQEKEACFFGNLFNGEGVFASSDRGRLHKHNSSSRFCALTDDSDSKDDEQEDDARCAPMRRIRRLKCNNLCEKDPKGAFYSTCTFNGVTYRAITTRMRHDEVFKCGDGICQYTEQCGTRDTPDNCKDCGPCQ
ncbi:hypothetical protein CYFUS_008704 [Cystobacter fuscus]|uniref:Uncharacterized protein n=1 Tax=Cystobacter fuscus TaxID=43 RepID=A0A250JH56_9BACT|nr:hypothetical protein [Cystobacter fuscus]ATB43224.1 hypothetical protein CYFUS_008704 [Cystobacter fuscus]